MSAQRYRCKSPGTVEAIQYNPPHNCAEVAAFTGEPHEEEGCSADALWVVVDPMADDEPAHPGDWIVRDATGALSVVPEDEFEAQYELDAGCLARELPAPRGRQSQGDRAMTERLDPPVLSDDFYRMSEQFAYQRMTVAEWRAVLLAGMDRPIIRGRLRKLIAKNLGAGVVELRLQPLNQET